MVFLKADFYFHREQIFLVREVEWERAPAVGDLVALGRGLPLVPVKYTYPWSGGLNVYLEAPNEWELALALREQGWRAQDPDPLLAT